jgi:NADH:ubiquinone oxidoreductase subunit 4 (subunit M)
MFGPLDNEDNRLLSDLSRRELATLVPLVVLAFWIGIRPAPFFRVLDEPVQRLVRQVEKTYEYPRAATALMESPHPVADASVPQSAWR